MRSQTAKTLYALCGLMFLPLTLFAQLQVDPIQAAAIEVNALQISGAVNEATEEHEKITALNSAITVELEGIRHYEEQVYESLKDASNLLNDALEVKRAADLTSQILSNLSKCTKAAVDHPEGAAVTALISSHYTRFYEEAMTVYGYISSIVTDPNTLLNAAERTAILSRIVNQLAMMNRSALNLYCQIRSYRWIDLVRHVAPDAYYSIVGCDYYLKQIKRDIDRL